MASFWPTSDFAVRSSSAIDNNFKKFLIGIIWFGYIRNLGFVLFIQNLIISFLLYLKVYSVKIESLYRLLNIQSEIIV
jgi:hypothetical protein